MAAARLAELTAAQAAEAFARRVCPANALAADADAIALACHAMAVRFERGGRLVVFGEGGSGCDAAHVVVEFVHPVIVGKRALPALALPGPDLAGQIELFTEPADIALGVSAGPCEGPVAEALRAARRAGLLTVGLFGRPAPAATGSDAALPGAPPDPDDDREVAEHLFVVPSSDPLVVKEVQVTTYHLLWELVHVFAEWADRSGAAR
ncbi:MAG TPA: SIS domain-containing protein [Pseudonocardia sp.]|jgi:D-sedoheptulose 7-phosphate isomerase|nr:SIS domain-containing protein [Pseudonocardia sp.]